MPLMVSNIRSAQHGSSLIEVMIALLVLAIGLLGFAGMQTQGIATGRQAYLHSTAAFLAEDMVERIRANTAQSKAYSMLFTDSGTNNHCDTTDCSAVDLMKWDQYKWQTRVASLLPKGQGKVAASQGANSYVTVTIQLCYTLDTSSANDVGCAAAAAALTGVDRKQYIYTMTTQIYPN